MSNNLQRNIVGQYDAVCVYVSRLIWTKWISNSNMVKTAKLSNIWVTVLSGFCIVHRHRRVVDFLFFLSIFIRISLSANNSTSFPRPSYIIVGISSALKLIVNSNKFVACYKCIIIHLFLLYLVSDMAQNMLQMSRMWHDVKYENL